MPHVGNPLLLPTTALKLLKYKAIKIVYSTRYISALETFPNIIFLVILHKGMIKLSAVRIREGWGLEAFSLFLQRAGNTDKAGFI